MYTIEQTEGELADAAKQLKTSAMQHDAETCEKIWKTFMAETVGYSEKTPDWWIHDAPRMIRRNTRFEVSDWASFREKAAAMTPYAQYYGGQTKYRLAAEEAERRYGGTWTLQYEY